MSKDTLSSLFDDEPASAEVDTSLDANATQVEEIETSEEQEFETQETEVNLDETEEEVQEVEQDSTEEENSEEPDENSADFWKNKYEAEEKRRRDLQSYNDKRINDLEKKITESLNAPQQPEQKVEPVKELSKEELQDLIYDDPEKAMIYVAQKNGLVNPQPQQPQVNINLQIQEEVMRQTHDDYDDTLKVFQSAVQINPQLLQEVQQSPNIAKAAYEAGKKIQEAQELQANPKAVETLKEKLRKELLEEMNTQQDKKRPSLRKVPASPGGSSGKRKDDVTIKSFFG